jgi:hypothetical protein
MMVSRWVRRGRWWGILAGLVIVGLGALALRGASAPAAAAGAAVVLRYDFASGVGEWRSSVPGAPITVAIGRGEVRDGHPSLEFDYTPTTSTSPAFYTLPRMGAPRARSVRFWIRCSDATPLQFALGERSGAGYYYSLQCPADQWVYVAIPLSDLILVPTAANAKTPFDPGQMNAIRFQDLSRYHSPANRLGPRRIWLNNLEFVTNGVVSRHESGRFQGQRGLTIDTFDKDALGWEAEANVKATSATVGGRGVMRLEYRQGKGERTPAAITHLRGAEVLRGMRSVRLVVRSQNEANLQVSFMEFRPGYQSATYSATVTVPAGNDWHPFVIPYEDFHPTPGTQNASEHFDPERIWMMQLADTLQPDPPRDNVLEVDEVAVIYGPGRPERD